MGLLWYFILSFWCYHEKDYLKEKFMSNIYINYDGTLLTKTDFMKFLSKQQKFITFALGDFMKNHYFH